MFLGRAPAQRLEGHLNAPWIDVEQSRVQLVTLRSSVHAASLLPGRDIHFLLFLPCPGTQIGYREGSFLPLWGEPLDPWDLNPCIHDRVIIICTDSCRSMSICLQNADPAEVKDAGRHGGCWEASPSSQHLGAHLGRGVRLGQEGRALHTRRSSGWEL